MNEETITINFCFYFRTTIQKRIRIGMYCSVLRIKKNILEKTLHLMGKAMYQ